MEFMPTSMPRVDDVTNRLFKTLNWKPHLSGKFAQTVHINLLEMRALKLELKRPGGDRFDVSRSPEAVWCFTVSCTIVSRTV